jgi:hypothetical protein
MILIQLFFSLLIRLVQIKIQVIGRLIPLILIIMALRMDVYAMMWDLAPVSKDWINSQYNY